MQHELNKQSLLSVVQAIADAMFPLLVFPSVHNHLSLSQCVDGSVSLYTTLSLSLGECLSFASLFFLYSGHITYNSHTVSNKHFAQRTVSIHMHNSGGERDKENDRERKRESERERAQNIHKIFVVYDDCARVLFSLLTSFGRHIYLCAVYSYRLSVQAFFYTPNILIECTQYIHTSIDTARY